MKKKLLPEAFVAVLFLFLLAAAVFYLFAVPAMVASHSIPPTRLGLAFAIFLYLQLWMLIIEYAYSSAASLYGFRRKRLLPFSDHFAERIQPKRQVSGFETIILCILSYFFMVYGFAVAYTFISHSDLKAFNCGELGIFDACYFSLITAATVGFGDIAPVSGIARALVMGEIVAGIVYAVFYFSVLAAGMQSNGSANALSSRADR